MANRDLNLSFTLTVSQWFEIYLKNYARSKLKTQTLNNYVTGFERVEDYIGYMKIIDVKNVNIVSAMQELEKEGYATTTIQQSLAVLKQVFALLLKIVSYRLIHAPDINTLDRLSL